MRMVRAALVWALALAALIFPLVTAAQDNRRAALVTIDDAIGPATADYVKEALAKAASRHDDLIILRLNTPGGLVASMRDIISDILSSPVPVVGYVAPSGAHAASAGTYILYATHIAAMAPGTNLGAATPVSIGGAPPSLPETAPDKSDKSKEPPQTKDAMMAKVTNDAVALIRSLAEMRGRNAEWAEKAVREASSLTANAALEAHVIDLVARNEQDLLNQVDGRSVELSGGEIRRLATGGMVIAPIEPGWILRFLAVITEPNVAFILMIVGIYGLIFEFLSPGAVAPGVIGTICLLLGTYALNMLPINYAGLALMLTGIALLLIEAYNPTVVIGLGGVISFVLGAVMLFRSDAEQVRLAWPVIGVTAALMAAFVIAVLGSVLRARRNPALTGNKAMHGLAATVLDWSGHEGHVLTQGEHWRAFGRGPFQPGETVTVKNVRNLTLEVERAPGKEVNHDV